MSSQTCNFSFCDEQQCQVWHSLITLCVKTCLRKDICELKWEAGTELSCQLAKGQHGCELGNICSSTCKSHGGKLLSEQWGEYTNVYFLIMQLHSSAYFPFEKTEQIGTTRSWPSWA